MKGEIEMNLDLSKIPINETLKHIAAYRGYTLAQVGKIFNQLSGKNYSPVSFRNKLSNGAIRYDELKKIGDILGFDVEIKMRD